MSSYRFLFLAMLVLAAKAAFAQTQISDPGAKQICASVKDVDLPAADRPTAAEEKSLARCSSVDLYFGFGGLADPVKARKCAYSEIDRGEKILLSGKAILTMVYANARGVPRNFDVALKLACTIGDAPGDAAGRVRQLDRLRKSNFASDNFSVCDHSSGRELYEQCAILQERFDKIGRDQKLADLTAKWTGAEKKAFHSLLHDSEKFFEVQVTDGTNLEGTFKIQERAFLENNLLASLEQFERGELPRYSAEEVSSAEAAEASAYQRTQTGEIASWGTVTREGVRRSEGAWRRYRAAWISFGKRRYPAVDEQSWRVWLDQERFVMLNKLLH